MTIFTAFVYRLNPRIYTKAYLRVCWKGHGMDAYKSVTIAHHKDWDPLVFFIASGRLWSGRANNDTDVSMRSHVAKTAPFCFVVLHQVRNIRQSVSRTVLQSLVSSLVISRLEYCNATLAGIHRIFCQGYGQRWMPLLRSSSRLRRLTTSPLLRQRHWLKASEWIASKCAVLVYKCLYRVTYLWWMSSGRASSIKFSQLISPAAWL